MATAVKAAGAKPPANIEGRDLIAQVSRDPEFNAERGLFWRMGPNYAVRKGRWNLIVVNKSETAEDPDSLVGNPVPDGIPAQVSPLGQYRLLFDMKADPGQHHDLATRRPDVVADLEREFRAWNTRNIDPKFTSRRQFRIDIDGRKVQLFN